MIYILHLDTKLKHAQHYVGFSTNKRTLDARIEYHRAGQAHCRFTQVLHELGITFTVARVFEGAQYDRDAERELKNKKKTRLYCPICSAKPSKFIPRGKNDKRNEDSVPAS